MLTQNSHANRVQRAFLPSFRLFVALLFLGSLVLPARAQQDPSIILINQTGLSSITSITTFCTSETIGVVFTDFIALGLPNPNIYNADNRYVLELSDPTGSFSSPTVLATSPYTSPLNRQVASGGFTGVISNTVVSGTGYRVRMATTSPVMYGAPFATPLIINASPAQPVFSSNLSVVQNGTLSLVNTATCSGTLVWGRTNGDLATGTGNISVPTSQTGIVSYTAVCQSVCGNSAAATAIVTVTVPIVPPTGSQPTITEFTGCLSSCQNLQAIATGKTFVFTGPNGYVFSIVYRQSGTYKLSTPPIVLPGSYTLTAYGNSRSTQLIIAVQ